MHPMVNIAVRAARAAGDVIARSIDRLDRVQVETKGRHDFVSDIDRRAEEVILYTLTKAYPNHAVVAEESGRHFKGKGPAEYTWIVDPLDGTANFLHGFPHFAVSIALQRENRLEAAVVYDPIRQELFTAHRGSGAQLDGRRVRVPKRSGLPGALIGTGFPFKKPAYMPAYLGMFQAVAEHAEDMRRAGSAALDLAYVAAGRMDGFFELGLKPWDIAAGALLVTEAGGMVSDFAGKEGYLESGHIIAGAPKVHGDLVRTLQPHMAGVP